MAGVVDDALELFHTLHELHHYLMIQFLRGYASPAQGGKIALLAHPFLGCLCQEQITLVSQVWTLVEMALERAVKEAQSLLLQFRPVILRYEYVLLVDNRKMRQNLYRLAPCRVHGLVFG